MNREEPKTGDVFRHFKGGLYKVICMGHHSETKERMVVYNKCYEVRTDFYMFSTKHEPCIRPLDMFMSEVDHEKYPDVEQKYRFEKVEE